jgi:hypothetical protein
MSQSFKGFYGATMTGKTTLARSMAREWAGKKNALPIVVLDPVGTFTAGGGWPDNAAVFSDSDAFWNWVGQHGNALLIIDEAGDEFSVGQSENHWLARRGRHYGYHVWFICQRPMLMAPNVRSQIDTAFVFRMSESDTKLVCADLGHDPPEKYGVDKGDYFVVRSNEREKSHANLFKQLGVKPK